VSRQGFPDDPTFVSDVVIACEAQNEIWLATAVIAFVFWAGR
jgi:hypothetical protein